MLRRTLRLHESLLGISMERLAERVVNGDRRALSRAITYVESANEEHRQKADSMLQEIARLSDLKRKREKPQMSCPPAFTRKEKLPSLRVAISGPPGAGKSCFIEALGAHLTGQGHKVAVLTIDPSSTISGGSLLGDKTRMDTLAFNPMAYVRPSPTRGCLGGVAEATYDALQICEGAGYEISLVETVGVGQSEVAARDMTDCFLLLLPPANGDELQGIKKGIVEVADLVAITKADGSTEALAQRTQAEYRRAMQLLRPYGKCHDWRPPVLTCSAHTHTGIQEVWETIQKFSEEERETLLQRRKEHRLTKLWECVRNDITKRIEADARLSSQVDDTQHGVEDGFIVPRLAARQILNAFAGLGAKAA